MHAHADVGIFEYWLQLATYMAMNVDSMEREYDVQGFEINQNDRWKSIVRRNEMNKTVQCIIEKMHRNKA